MRYLAQDLGPSGITANCIATGVIATGRIMATVILGSSRSNRDRAELVAVRRLGTVEDCAKVVEFLAHRPVRLRDRCCDPDRTGDSFGDNRLRRAGALGGGPERRSRSKARWLLYKEYTFSLYNEIRRVGVKSLISLAET
jgi:hypothetical protein